MRTPPGAAENVAVPIFWPVALTMSARADWAICADDFCGGGGGFSVGVVRGCGWKRDSGTAEGDG